MPAIALLKKILDLDENELLRVLMDLELTNRDLYNELVEKINDL